MREYNKSVIPRLKETNSPIIQELNKPQIKYIKYQSHGLKKLYARIGKRQ